MLHIALQVSKTTDGDLIIGCDTIVTKDGQIFEKPDSREIAKTMLSGALTLCLYISFCCTQ